VLGAGTRAVLAVYVGGPMHRSMLALAAVLICGCWGTLPAEGPQCAPAEWSPPSARRELESFAPEPALAPKKRPQRWGLSPGVFNSVGYAEGIYPELRPLVAPSLRGGIVVCNFNLRPIAGIDGVHGITTNSTPDLIVWAEAGGQKLSAGPKPDSLHATFAFRLSLEEGDRVRFSFVDRDFFSSDDWIGHIDGVYPGRLPFTVRGRGAAAVCGALPAERVAGLLAESEKELARELSLFEAHEPTMETPIDFAARPRIEALLARIVYFAKDAPSIQATLDRVGAVSEQQWGRYLEKLDALAGTLPPPAAWVSLNASFEGHAAGVICQSGEGIAPSCGVELLLRARAALPRTACPASMSDFGGLGRLEVIASDGATEAASIRSIRRGKVYLRGEAAVPSIKAGDVLSVEVKFSGYHYRTSPKEWDLPLLRVGKTVLRIL
jgi:hypothetical protein